MPEHSTDLSVVVVVHNMAREAPRTLFSLSADYQRHIDAAAYEVIVVDNGSDIPLDRSMIAGLSGNFRVISMESPSPSPARAINRGLAEARGSIVGVMIDGARIATPGLLHFARHGARLYEKSVVATLGWYLGDDYQAWAIADGFDIEREDALLDTIAWPSDGYRLFEVGTMDESSDDGWFQSISESNALFASREVWAAVGGLDERFDAPGGGLVNLDTYARLLELPGSQLVILLGEATFHQLHGGVSTNVTPARQRENFDTWSAQYAAIRGKAYETPHGRDAPTYLGTLPRLALARIVRAAICPSDRNFAPPLGADFDAELWTTTRADTGGDERFRRIVDLGRSEFRAGRFEAACAVARLLRACAPDEHGLDRTLSLVARSLPLNGPPPSRRAEYHRAIAETHRILADGQTSIDGVARDAASDARGPESALA